MNCPNCDVELEFEEDELDEGDEFTCEECGASIRVTSTGPVELEATDEDLAGEDGFDDEDEEDEDDIDEDEEDEDEEEDDWK